MKIRQKNPKFSVFVVLFLGFFSVSAHASYILSFDSSEQSWVGAGQSRYITAEDGYDFTANTNFDNGLSFSIRRDVPFEDPLYDYWRLELAAPFNALLTEGLYEDATRWPFQDADAPGLTFAGNHRGNNRNLGFFNILEASYDPAGNLDSFAVNFTQYGEQDPDRWIVGQFRFNSDVPVAAPEPGTALLFLAGLLGLVVTSRKSLQGQHAQSV